MASTFVGGTLGRLLALTALLLLAVLRPARPWQSRATGEDLARRAGRSSATTGDAPSRRRAPAPARFSPLERSLSPASCGTCHPDQFRDWQSSVHAKSMGPGISGQLAEMIKSEPAAARSCFTCHAPLAEQAPLDPRQRGARAQPRSGPASAVPGRRLRKLPRARASALRPAAARWDGGEPCPAREPPSQWPHADDGLSPLGILRELPPVRPERPRAERQAAREHVRGVAGEPGGAARAAMPGLPYAGSPPSLARHPRSGDGEVRRADQAGHGTGALPAG